MGTNLLGQLAECALVTAIRLFDFAFLATAQRRAARTGRFHSALASGLLNQRVSVGKNGCGLFFTFGHRPHSVGRSGLPPDNRTTVFSAAHKSLFHEDLPLFWPVKCCEKLRVAGFPGHGLKESCAVWGGVDAADLAPVLYPLHTAAWNQPAMSKAKTVLEVRILSGGRAGEQQLFFDASEVRIGRHPTADVLLPDASVSRQHAQIVHQGSEGYAIVDAGSTAGIYDLSTGQKVTRLAIPEKGPSRSRLVRR